MDSTVGSSPHTRGALSLRHFHLFSFGIIPAYAGSTSRAVRSCALGAGSSPHTRGARCPARRPCRPGRIIPAYAGSTKHGPYKGTYSTGSSPHTRGAQRRPGVELSAHRIIPAYAGSTSSTRPYTRSIADHPRIRGEHAGRRAVRLLAGGSSPHTRGVPRRQAVRLEKSRIIPAYAGSTRPRCTAPRAIRDHPRIRGEHLYFDKPQTRNCGSSPHTRGARDEAQRRVRVGRIIPAYAGSTGSRRPVRAP